MRRQAAIPPFIVAFLYSSKGLIVEVDGGTQVPEADARRDANLAPRGFATIRFTNEDVRDNMESVLIALLERLESLPDRWSGANAVPTPYPSARIQGTMRGMVRRSDPEGEGLGRC